MKAIEFIKTKVRFCIAAVMRFCRFIGDSFFEVFGYHDYDYQVYDYYGNFKTKRVWRLKFMGKIYTRNYDDDFA